MLETVEHRRIPARLSKLASKYAFAVCCGTLFAVICLALPPYFPLLEPDSGGYLNFALNRTAIYPYFLRALSALDFTLLGVTHVQVFLFAFAVAMLAGALLRWGFGRYWIVLMVLLLAANGYFSSFQRTILTESLGFSTIVAASAFLLDYLRTGHARFLAIAGVLLGLTVGIRPAGLMVLPILIVVALLMRNQRNVSAAMLVVVAIIPAVAGWIPERLLYRLEHGNQSASVLPYVLAGKAAMLARPGLTFTGPNAQALQQLGDKLTQVYAPAHRFLAGLPSFVAWPVMVAFYEAAGQFQVINNDLARLAAESGTTPEKLAVELGQQTILSNPGGYLGLSLTHYLGQWSITALTFPPTARVVNAYRESVPEIPLLKEVTAVPFTPQAEVKSAIVYPTFLTAGAVTLGLTFLLPFYLIWPPGQGNPRARYLMVAALFAATCHSSMLLTSLVNVSTPRFLMMVYPHILLSGLFLVRALRPQWFEAPAASTQN